MTFRPPRQPTAPVFTKSPQDALDYEIAQEKAAAFGRLGRALERALAALAEFDKRHTEVDAPQDRKARATLVGEAGHALWQFIVQREACGLRDTRQVMREYRVPAEVQARMGVFPVRNTSRRP